MRAALGGVVAAVGLALSGAAPVPADVPSDDVVPVFGQAFVAALGETEERPPTMTVSVHGVRRFEAATILYYSVGFSGEAPDPELLPVTRYGTGPETYGTLQASSGATFMDTAAVIDVPGKRSYAALRTERGEAVKAPPPVAPEDRFRLSERAVVQWVALAPIPKRLTEVDVLIGSAFVRGVPVGDGPLTPEVDDPAPTVGTGWPTIPTTQLVDAVRDGTRRALVTTVRDRPEPEPTPDPSATSSPSPSPSPSATEG